MNVYAPIANASIARKQPSMIATNRESSAITTSRPTSPAAMRATLAASRLVMKKYSATHTSKSSAYTISSTAIRPERLRRACGINFP